MLLDSTGGGAFRGRFATGSCHLDGFDGLGLAISALSLFCSATPEFPFFCLGVNVAVTGMCVLAIFNGHADVGTPFGAIQPWIGLGEAGFRGLDFGLGVTLMVITLSSAGCV